MESINIKNENVFDKIIDEICIDVGSRKDGRKQEIKELFSLLNFLKLRKKAQNLKFPINILKRESPDFELIEGDEIFGIEVTESSNELYQALLTYCDINPEFTFDPCSIKYGMTMQNINWRSLLKKRNSKTSVKGWGGYQPELFSAKWARDAVCKKLPLLGGWKTSFEGAINILLYSNSPGWNLYYEKFAIFLQNLTLPLLEAYKNELNTISFLSSDGKCAILDIRLGFDGFVKFE